MHTLWLASWYPNRTDPFNGDFVQRHALALAGRAPVTVIHVAKEEAPAGRGGAAGAPAGRGGAAGAAAPRETLTHRGRLTERISYFHAPATRWPLWNKLVSQTRAFRAYRRAFRAHVRENGRPDLIHVHVCMNAGLYALYLRWTRGIPFVVTEHFTAYIRGNPEDFFSRPWPYRFFNRLILEQAEAVHSVSRFLLGEMGKIARLKRTAVIPNAVDTALFRAEPTAAGAPGDPPQAAGPFRFIHVSNFKPQKNVPGMLEAFALLLERRRDWELLLIGPADDAIRAYGASKGIEAHLRWVGEVPYATVAAELRASGALVQFSRWENQPCVISEAFCCGVPVVSSAVGGIPEVLGAGVDGATAAADGATAASPAGPAAAAGSGLLVPPQDVAALADALHAIMEKPGKRAQLAAAAAAVYGYDAVGAALEAFSNATKTTHSKAR
ncbi:glycosyltransferase [Dinghuibacter silviterrae]|uniref:Glycosyltransferase involved in cell wall biosynthesis n=1 Tax=Dinghuibacter silviterrae TaxID=1539049 RepID=A0A4R8DIY5_9BACT|nr:glycosyltransferase [Dinghuibacter silviterrae]TDW97545.1 glycosyltransferase involved in cell wall biosynthesis [Dinghuibacter silviterrae]